MSQCQAESDGRTPELDPTVVTAGDDEPVVELKAGDRVVVRAEPVLRLESGQVKDDHSSVRAAGDEHVRDRVELQLADERGVALEERQELSVKGIEVGKR